MDKIIQVISLQFLSDTSDGLATVAQVEAVGGDYTTYNMPDQATFDEAIFQQFNFTPTPPLTYPPTNVSICIVHQENNKAEDQKLEVWEEDASVWRNYSIPIRTSMWRDEVNVSIYIDTQNDINNLKVRYLARTNTSGNRDANIDYIAVYVEWLE